jgi:hypothetical protein
VSEKDLTRLIEILERALGREWIDAAEWIRSLPEASIAAIEAKIIANDFAGLFREIETAAASAARTFAAATHAAFERAGRAEAKWIDKQPSMKERLIRFDAQDSEVIRAARENTYKNVQGLVEETRENLRTVLVDGQRAGTNPRVMAREIRHSIGLTDQQAKWVRSYEADLRAGRFSQARSRELHDNRLLRNVKRGDTLTDAQIEKAVERYRKAQLKYRAEMIARTEAGRNVHSGSEEAFRQAIARGDLAAEDVESEWHPGPRTKHARDGHRAASLLEQRPRWGETFLLPSGARMAHPGDDSHGAGASDIVHCRCTRSLTLA